MSLVSPGAAAALAAAQIPERAAEDVAYSLPQDSGGQGIPGAREQNATCHANACRLRGFLCPETEAALAKRAVASRPPVPILALAHYHRVMLDGKGGRVETLAEKRARVDDLGVRPSWTVIDAGCSWGRLGIPLIERLDADRYYGLDIDEFSLRAFISVELALERPELLAKRPRLLASKAFGFRELLGDKSRRADLVVFLAVLKHRYDARGTKAEDHMPEWLLEKALRNAADVLRRPDGRVAIFQDASAYLLCIAKNAGLDVKQISRKHNGGGTAILGRGNATAPIERADCSHGREEAQTKKKKKSGNNPRTAHVKLDTPGTAPRTAAASPAARRSAFGPGN
jgi:hypothetical protein